MRKSPTQLLQFSENVEKFSDFQNDVEKWSKMEETDGKGKLNWYRTNIYRYYVYGGYELKFNRKRMWKRKYGLWTKVKDNQLEKFIIVRNWRLHSWMSSEIFKSCTKNWLTNELFTLSHCNNALYVKQWKLRRK